MIHRFHHLPDHPLDAFKAWMTMAEKSELNDPNAAAPATADLDGRPSVRMVLIKHWDSDGFRFFTNATSQKGRELTQNPRASLCMHWKSLRRQIRIDGGVHPVDDDTSDVYFHSRSRRSQISAAVSRQSEQLKDRAILRRDVDQFTLSHLGSIIPRPLSWRGFVLRPERFEFWSDGEDRLHERILFRRTDDTWESSLLYP